MAQTRGWHRITKGLYRYTNAAGKSLAYAGKEAKGWEVLVIPMADPAREFKHRTKPATLREAKVLAEDAYLSSTLSALAADRATMKRLRDR
jgi:hypothetical protein